MPEGTDCFVQITDSEQGHWDIQMVPGGVALRVFTDKKLMLTFTWEAAHHLAEALTAALARER